MWTIMWMCEWNQWRSTMACTNLCSSFVFDLSHSLPISLYSAPGFYPASHVLYAGLGFKVPYLYSMWVTCYITLIQEKLEYGILLKFNSFPSVRSTFRQFHNSVNNLHFFTILKYVHIRTQGFNSHVNFLHTQDMWVLVCEWRSSTYLNNTTISVPIFKLHTLGFCEYRNIDFSCHGCEYSTLDQNMLACLFRLDEKVNSGLKQHIWQNLIKSLT